jgi:hypothetical protein
MESKGRRRLAFGDLDDGTRAQSRPEFADEGDVPPYGKAHGKQLPSVRASRGDGMRASAVGDGMRASAVRASLPSLPFGPGALFNGGPEFDDPPSATSALGGVLGELLLDGVPVGVGSTALGDALSLPALDDDVWAAGVHVATWAVARAFGEQGGGQGGAGGGRGCTESAVPPPPPPPSHRRSSFLCPPTPQASRRSTSTPRRQICPSASTCRRPRSWRATMCKNC